MTTTSSVSMSSLDDPKAGSYPQQPSRYRKILTAILANLKIIFVYAIPGSVFVGLTFGLIAASGAAVVVIGNIVLRSVHMSGYTTSAHAAAIGATGACISALITGCLSVCAHYGQQSKGNDPWYIRCLFSVLFSTLAGVLGCAILHHNRVDLGGIDIQHSAAAAALGGLISSIGSIFIGPVLMMAISVILSPLFLAVAMKMGLNIRSNGGWEQRGRRIYSHCICCGSCEGDEEIDAEQA